MPPAWPSLFRNQEERVACLFTSIFLVCVQLGSDVTTIRTCFRSDLLVKLLNAPLLGLSPVLAAEAVYSVAMPLEQFQINQSNGYRMLNKP